MSSTLPSFLHPGILLCVLRNFFPNPFHMYLICSIIIDVSFHLLAILIPSLTYSYLDSDFKKIFFKYLFIWLRQDLVVACGIFVAACGIFICSMQDLQLQHEGSFSCNMQDL